MSFLRLPVSFRGVLQRLSGKFVSGLMVLFTVVSGSNTVRVCRKFVKLRSSPV